MESNLQETGIKEMEIRYTVPNKSRPRIFVAHWRKGMIEAFRELWNKYPDANPISFNGHEIKKSA